MSYEMWFHGKYLTPVMYGMNYWRPPLYNLMIIPVAQLIGWDHMLVAARLVALTATLSSALLLAWFVRRLSGDKTFAAFTALIYLTLGDVLFYRGWLCYSDPVFGLFILLSIVFGWLAIDKSRYTYLAVAVAAVTAAFLTKALTAYIFYAIAMISVVSRMRRWAFLYSWRSLLLNGLAFVFPLFWYRLVPAGDDQSHGMLADITSRLLPRSVGEYLRHVLTYPMETLFLLLPIAGVLLYASARRQDLGKWRSHPYVCTALIIALANYLPYWLSPKGDIRYVIPILPFVGLILAYMAFHGAQRVREWSVKWIIAVITLKFLFGLLGFPFFHQQSRASFEPVAKDILRIAGNHPLHVTHTFASGISVVAHIDRLIYPKAPLTWPPAQFNDGFLISYSPAQDTEVTVKKYSVGRDEIYLLCRGAACTTHE